MSFQKAHQDIQKSILKYAKSDYVGGVLTSIIAAARVNNTITAKDFGSEDGKLRELKINYLPPACDDDGTCSDNICETGLAPAPQQVYFKLQQCTASKVLTIKQSDMRDLDSIGANQYALDLVNQRLETVRKKLSAQITALLIANRGVLPNGSTSKLIPLIDPKTGQVVPTGIWEVERQFIDAELGSPYVVGGAPVWTIQKGTAIGTGNDRGQNIGQVATQNWWYDKYINGAIGNSTENLIAFDPQLIKFISFNFNSGRFATDLKGLQLETMYQVGPDWIYSTMLDPSTGILWDLDVIFDKCTKSWNFQWKLNWDLFTLPVNVCGVQGMNGIMQFTTCAPQAVDCGTPDSGNTPTSEAYEYDPSDIVYPLIVNDFTVNDNHFKPMATLASNTDLLAMFNQYGGGGFSIVAGVDEAPDTIQYTGYSPISGKINTTAYAFTVVEA